MTIPSSMSLRSSPTPPAPTVAVEMFAPMARYGTAVSCVVVVPLLSWKVALAFLKLKLPVMVTRPNRSSGLIVAVAWTSGVFDDVSCEWTDLDLWTAWSDVLPGTAVVALVDGEEATLKRIEQTPGSCVLHPANPDHDPQRFAPDRVQIQGVLVGQMRVYR